MSRFGTAVLIGLTAVLGAAAIAQEGRKITGIVVARSSEQPIQGAIVRYEDDAGGPVQTARTDDKGQFEIARGTSGIVTVSAQSFGTLRRGWPPRESRELRLELAPPAMLSGTLVDAVTRRDVVGRVTVRVEHPLNHVSKSARVRGAFRFVDLLDGPAAIYAHATGFAPRFGTLMVEAGKHSSVQVDMTQEARASGRVLNQDDSPSPGAVVRVGYDRSIEGSTTLAGLVTGNVTADSDGVFNLRGLVPGTAIALQAVLDGRRSAVVTINSIAADFEQTGIILRMQ